MSVFPFSIEKTSLRIASLKYTTIRAKSFITTKIRTLGKLWKLHILMAAVLRHHHRSSEYQYSNSSSNIGGPSGGQVSRGMGMGPGGGGGGSGRGPMNMMSSMNVLSGQAFSETDLMSDLPKKKFTGRCRLFVGNLPNDLKEQELKELFAPHGDIAECYLSGKGFAFLRLVGSPYLLTST